MRWIVQVFYNANGVQKWRDVCPFDKWAGGLKAAQQKLEEKRSAKPQYQWRIETEEVEVKRTVLDL